MAWKWPHNLQAIHDIVVGCYPGIVIFGIGDAKHLAKDSDHNEDLRGIVHAEDIMTLAYQSKHGIKDDAVATAIVAWLLTPQVRASLQYVIHNRKIWSVTTSWASRPYTGDDPHTDHVHVSGKHGTVGADAHTGTGYNTAAEAMSPAGSPCEGDDMPTADEIAKAVWNYHLKEVATDPDLRAGDVARAIYFRTNATTNQQLPAIMAKLGALTPTALATAIAAKLPPTTVVDVATLETALVGALTELAADSADAATS